MGDIVEEYVFDDEARDVFIYLNNEAFSVIETFMRDAGLREINFI